MTRFFLPFTLNSLILRSERVIQNLMESMIRSHKLGTRISASTQIVDSHLTAIFQAPGTPTKLV